MPDLWVILPVIVSAAVILLLYTIPPPWVKRYLNVLGDADLQDVLSPHNLGMTIRHAYPPEDVAGIIDAVITSQKPALKQFAVDEVIPFLAAAGSKEVAANARGGKSALAGAVGDLGGGAAGLQGLASLIAKPGKSSGMGDLIQYLPMIQQFMAANKGQSQDSNNMSPTTQVPGSNGGHYHSGGKLGGT